MQRGICQKNEKQFALEQMAHWSLPSDSETELAISIQRTDEKGATPDMMITPGVGRTNTG